MNKNIGLLGIFLLVIIGAIVGLALVLDPLSGALVAGAVLIFILAVKMPWVVVAILLGFTPFRALWSAGGASMPEVLYSLTFLLLMGCWLVYSVTDVVINGHMKSVKSPLVPPLIMLFTAAISSVFIAISKGRSFETWGSQLNLVSFYAMYFIAVGYLRSLKEVNKVFIAFLIVSTIAIIKGIFYRLVIEPIPLLLLGSSVPKITMATGAGSVAFLMLLPFIFLSKSVKTKYLLTAVVALFGLQQVLSFIRSRWLGDMAGAIFLFLVLSPAKRSRFVKYSLVILLLLLIYVHMCAMFPSENLIFKLPYMIEARFSTFFKPSEELTALTRFSEWNAVMEKIRKHPVLGNGLGTKVKYVRYDRLKLPVDISDYIHNSYLFYWLNTGIAGLFAILWLSFAFICYGLRVYKTTRDDYYKAFVLGCVTTFVGLSVTSIIGPEISFPGRTIVVGFLMGSVAAIDKLAAKVKQ